MTIKRYQKVERVSKSLDEEERGRRKLPFRRQHVLLCMKASQPPPNNTSYYTHGSILDVTLR